VDPDVRIGETMGLMDKAKEMLGGHGDKTKSGIDKAADVADDKTQGKYGDKIDMGADKAKDGIDKMSNE
jgi:hypothetical protein